jgi:methionyl-tRNA formyltransferase
MHKQKKKILVVTDNPVILIGFKKIIKKKNINESNFDYRCTKIFKDKFSPQLKVRSIDIKKESKKIVNKYRFILYLHGRQIVPNEIIKKIKSINIHPGYNPYNRGMFPHVFSIMNGLPAGATLHEMDEELDHGPIIAQTRIKVLPEDTSYTLYKRCVKAELNLLEKNIESIINGNYKTYLPNKEGNMNMLKDYKLLSEIDLDKKINIGTFLNYLRAYTHKGYENAYFIDKTNGDKIYITIKLKRKKLDA